MENEKANSNKEQELFSKLEMGYSRSKEDVWAKIDQHISTEEGDQQKGKQVFLSSKNWIAYVPKKPF